MRARDIKPGFYKSEQLAECSMPARLLFPGLWMMADREGRLEYRPKRIKAEIFPYDLVDCSELIAELEREGLVLRYNVAGCEYLFIPGFSRHQCPHIKEKPSEIPPYPGAQPGKHGESTVQAPDKHGTDPSSSLTPSSLPPEDKDSSLRSESSCPGSASPTPDVLSGTSSPPPDKPKRKPPPSFAEDSEPYRLAVFMRDTLKANVPTLKEPDLQRWAADFDVALRNDERMKDVRLVAMVVKWACSDGFWRANIQSPDKLRKQFDQLTAKMEAEASKARASPNSLTSTAAIVPKTYAQAQDFEQRQRALRLKAAREAREALEHGGTQHDPGAIGQAVLALTAGDPRNRPG